MVLRIQRVTVPSCGELSQKLESVFSMCLLQCDPRILCGSGTSSFWLSWEINAWVNGGYMLCVSLRLPFSEDSPPVTQFSVTGFESRSLGARSCLILSSPQEYSCP